MDMPVEAGVFGFWGSTGSAWGVWWSRRTAGQVVLTGLGGASPSPGIVIDVPARHAITLTPGSRREDIRQ